MSDGIQKDQPTPNVEPVIEAPAEPVQLHVWHQLLVDRVSQDAVISCVPNAKNNDLITIIVNPEHFLSTATVLKNDEQFQFDYCRNVSGSDLETHMEVAYYLCSMTLNHEVCIKATTNRETPEVQSLTSVWETANWNEREIFDLLGINFTGHPDMRRIMMPDNWVGHPLRKDYVPLDPEV